MKYLTFFIYFINYSFHFGHKIYLMITNLCYNKYKNDEGHTRLKKYGTKRVLFASAYTAKQLQTIYYPLSNAHLYWKLVTIIVIPFNIDNINCYFYKPC